MSVSLLSKEVTSHSGVHSILTLFSFQRSSPSCDGLYILPNSQELVKNFFEEIFSSFSQKDISRPFSRPFIVPRSRRLDYYIAKQRLCQLFFYIFLPILYFSMTYVFLLLNFTIRLFPIICIYSIIYTSNLVLNYTL